MSAEYTAWHDIPLAADQTAKVYHSGDAVYQNMMLLGILILVKWLLKKKKSSGPVDCGHHSLVNGQNSMRSATQHAVNTLIFYTHSFQYWPDGLVLAVHRIWECESAREL